MQNPITKPIIALALGSALIPGATQAQQGGKTFRPNILCLVCEDISPYIGCYGDRNALTPNIDRLAREGVRFTNVFSVAGVCAPSRNALITGMYPTSIGGNNMRTNNKRKVMNVPDSLQIPPYECTPPPKVKCYTEYLRAAGYFCTNNEKTDYQFTPPLTAWDENGRTAHWRNRPEGMPFLSIFNFMRSHESQVKGWEHEPLAVHPDSVDVPPYFPDTEIIRRDIARVYTNNTIMDMEVGMVLAQLEKDGLLDSTIIIFYSDHGGPLPRGKREIYDSGLKVPFIIRFPNKEFAGQVVNDLVSFVDIPPTLLSLAGIAVPAHMQGQAFWGEQKTAPRRYVFAARDRMDEWFDCRRSVRDHRYRYVRNYRPDLPAYMDLEFRKQLNTMQELLRLRDQGKLNEDQMYYFRMTKAAEELYDLSADPFELHNLAADPALDTVLVRMRSAMDQWLERIDDKGVKYKTEKGLCLSMWPDGTQPQTQTPKIKRKGKSIILSCATEGASLAYQIDGEGLSGNPSHWHLYTAPIPVAKNQVVTAKAFRLGYAPSEATSDK